VIVSRFIITVMTVVVIRVINIIIVVQLSVMLHLV
jgi:hypothetical protein